MLYFSNLFVFDLPQRQLYVQKRPISGESVEEGTAKMTNAVHTFHDAIGRRNVAALGSVTARLGCVGEYLDVEDLVDGSSKEIMEGFLHELQVWCQRSPNLRLAIRICLRTGLSGMRSGRSEEGELEMELSMNVTETGQSIERALRHIAENGRKLWLTDEESSILQATLVGWRDGLVPG